MFESAEIGHAIDKERYAKEEPALREALLNTQYDLLQSKRFPVIALFSGVDGAGKGETVNLLHEWMDPRHIETHAFDAEAGGGERPPFYRFWKALPPKGKIGIFFTSWYTEPILSRVYRRSSNVELDLRMEQNRRFERMLAAEGALILKFWFHLSKDRQRERLTRLASKGKTRFRVTPLDWKHFKLYDRFRTISERALRQTSTAEAPWIIVEGTDERYRSLTVGKAIENAVRARLDEPSQKPPASHAAPFIAPVDGVHLINRLDLSRKTSKEDYERELPRLQRKIALLSLHPRYKEMASIAVFEGSDAAGKGGAIRRLASALDARQYSTCAIAAPSEEERAQPYLWRFWRHIPRRGKLAIFDRSWYGRVLVERVEGFCTESDFMRAYAEINDFEEQLARHQILVSKFWLQISPDEQLRRFKEREATSFKRFKITADDWRNREKAAAYEDAVRDMVERTSTEIAPWTLVEAEDKYYARLKVLRTYAERVEEALG